jgi:hypothetical protein
MVTDLAAFASARRSFHCLVSVLWHALYALQQEDAEQGTLQNTRSLLSPVQQ